MIQALTEEQGTENVWTEQPTTYRVAGNQALKNWASVFARENVIAGTAISHRSPKWDESLEIVDLDAVLEGALKDRLKISLWNRYQDDSAALLERKAEMDRLMRTYVLDNQEAVQRFLSLHRSVAGLLLEAASALRACFGESEVMQLQVHPNDEDFSTIYAFVLWRHSAEQARAALKQFDDTWGAANSGKVAGRITFDYRLV